MSRSQNRIAKRRISPRQILSLALAGMMLVPSAASSNYLYEVMPPELHPYVLLIVDNSGSMLCQDGLYDDDGNRTYEGLYQDAGSSCHANYCRRADDSDLWVCPRITEAQADDPNHWGSCLPQDKGPWCNATKTVEICDVDCQPGPCLDTRQVDCNCRQGDCVRMGTEQYDCEPGDCVEWNQKTVCEDGTTCVKHEQVDGPECLVHQQVDGPECAIYKQVNGDVCLEYYQVDGPTCLSWHQVNGDVCLEHSKVNGDVCLEWYKKNGDVCLQYNQVNGDICLEWYKKNGDVCLEYNQINGDICLEWNKKWIPPAYTGDECLNWESRTRTTQGTCNAPDCRNLRCVEDSEKCTNTTCKTYGPKYDCRTEYYDCQEVCEIKGKGDNQWRECHQECKTREVDCKQDCIEYNKSCSTTCDVWGYEQCTARSPKQQVPGTGIYVDDLTSCKTWNKVNGTCKKWNQVDDLARCKTWNKVNGTCKTWNQVDDLNRCRTWNQVDGPCVRWNQVDGPNCRQWEQVDGPNCKRWNQVDGTECLTWKKIDGPCIQWKKVDGACIEWEQVNCHPEDDRTSCKKRGEPQNCKERETGCIEYGPDACDSCDKCILNGPQICGCRQSEPIEAPCDCPSRLETAQSVLATLIPGLDNLTLGFARYGKFEAGGPRDAGSDGDVKNCGVLLDNPLPGSRDEILGGIGTMFAEGGTPIAKSLLKAREHIAQVAANDPAAGCRPYFVILVTDGEESCALDSNFDTDHAYLEDQVKALRQLTVNGLAGDTTLDVRTFILGFGPELASQNPELHSLSKLARLGGTAEVDGTICTPREPGAACTAGSALFALRRNELVDKLNSAFQKITEGEYAAQAPVIGSVPQEASELGRVSRNFMAYSTFRQPGYSGHLYGIRLFQEDEEETGHWKFTDLSEMDLDACGTDGNPCVFDAGRLLTNRTKPRRIFTAVPQAKLEENLGGLTLPLSERAELTNDPSGWGEFGDVFGAYASLVELPRLLGDERPPNVSEAIAERIMDLDGFGADADREAVVRWLHGDTRSWKLADIYHGGAAIVGRPPYNYRTRGYDQFKKELRARPDMIYIGANDGMIHAFHAGPDLLSPTPRWEQAGEEAWAWLPVNMFARAASAILEGYEEEQRFFSQDLSCRIDDVLVFDNQNELGELDCGSDTLCGWRTVLLCGQGWGGSWFTALDVSDPLDPKPLWESTFDGIEGEGSAGIGKTWTVPSVGLLNLADSTSPTAKTRPTWAAVYGSGYNADMKDLSSNYYEAYRILNLPFDGAYAYHGNGTSDENPHVFVQDLATGRYIRIFHQHEEDEDRGSIVADIPLLDLDGDGFIDVAYVGNWNSRMDRIVFGKNAPDDETGPVIPLRTHPDSWSNACRDLFEFGEGKPITSSPSVMVDPLVSNRVYLFAGAGVDRGSYPDEQSATSALYGFRGFLFDDDGTSDCPVGPGTDAPDDFTAEFPRDGNLCADTGSGNVALAEILQENTRLLGSPLLTLQANTDRWLSFTTWNPDQSNSCADGTASLYCLNVNGGSRCVPCGQIEGEPGGPGGMVPIETGGRKPPSPVTADGQIYIVGPKGPERVGNQEGDGPGISGEAARPNVNAPRAVVISWREIFEP